MAPFNQNTLLSTSQRELKRRNWEPNRQELGLCREGVERQSKGDIL